MTSRGNLQLAFMLVLSTLLLPAIDLGKVAAIYQVRRHSVIISSIPRLWQPQLLRGVALQWVSRNAKDGL